MISENFLLLLEGVTASKFLCQCLGDLEVWVHDFLEATLLVAVSALALLRRLGGLWLGTILVHFVVG